MATATWTKGQGWHDASVSLRAAAAGPGVRGVHYAQEIFEGLKAYRHADGSVWLFRPEMNARRMVQSAKRLCLPEPPEEDFLASIEALVKADERRCPRPTAAKIALRAVW